MHRESVESTGRRNHIVRLDADLVVAGGGLAGVCAAVTAARQGVQVVLVQDRPVLGGNASSEVRLWALGATSHMGNNNRWSREGGVIEEILLENLYRNREGNALILDTIILEKVVQEPNITLLLNTCIHTVNKSDERTIASVTGFCSQNSTQYEIFATLFCDASGDGIVGFLAGAAFRMGGEARSEFGEELASEVENRELLGHTLYFYSKRLEHKVNYVPPAFALNDVTVIPRYKSFNQKDDGCGLWWIEYGGNLDTVHQTEDIKWELWKIVYGVWDHIKNSGEFDDVDHLTLEWVGIIPGKRESRRFEGLYMLRQQDIVKQTRFKDAVAHGGWAIDIHPAEGIYSDQAPCAQWHSKGVYHIPYRCYVSRDIDNMFIAGRIVSTTHIAFGSTRVMLTCALGGQAVGAAAAICVEEEVCPAEVLEAGRMTRLQAKLNLLGQRIPHVALPKGALLSSDVEITTSSELVLSGLPANGPMLPLSTATAQLLPLQAGRKYSFGIEVEAKQATRLVCELRVSGKPENYTPDQTLERIESDLSEGRNTLELVFSVPVPADQYGALTFLKNDLVSIKASTRRVTAIMTVFNKEHRAVSNNGSQVPAEGSGIEAFEFWTPARRPNGHNLAMTISPPLSAFSRTHLVNGYQRPHETTNAWVADPDDPQPRISLRWNERREISGVTLYFDSDLDHALESTYRIHPERVIPFCVRHYRILDSDGTVIHVCESNYQGINRVSFQAPVLTAGLILELDHPSADVPAALYGLVVHNQKD